MYSPNFVIGIYGPKSIQKHITVETEAAPYEITIGLLEICSLGHRRQIWHNHRKVDVWDDIWTSYRDLVLSNSSCPLYALSLSSTAAPFTSTCMHDSTYIGLGLGLGLVG